MVRLALLFAFLGLSAACEAPDAGLASIESGAVGVALRELPRATLRSLGLPYGLAVIRVEATAAGCGLLPGDVIYGVNLRRIGSVVEFARLLAERQPGAPLSLLVRRGKVDLYLAVDPASRPRRPTDTLLRT